VLLAVGGATVNNAKLVVIKVKVPVALIIFPLAYVAYDRGGGVKPARAVVGDPHDDENELVLLGQLPKPVPAE
jgi:hypothetical protein